MVVSGVRSSWEASATNWRSLASDAARAVTSSSMRVSMWLSAAPSSAASVPGVASGIRRLRSPSAIAVAVAVI